MSLLPSQMSCVGTFVHAVYNNVVVVVSSSPSQAAGGATLTSGGAYRPPLDKLEAGMELVKEAATHSGLTLGNDFSVLIDVGAEKLFDQV